jgi:septal ring factor EnvC (AmiA/AmiB activator)
MHDAIVTLQAEIRNLKATVAGQAKTLAQQQSDFHATLAQQQQEIKELTASLRDQASLLQKVSAQLEDTRPAPRMAANNQ